MQINRKYRAKAVFINQSLHKNNYTTEKNNLQGKSSLFSEIPHYNDLKMLYAVLSSA